MHMQRPWGRRSPAGDWEILRLSRGQRLEDGGGWRMAEAASGDSVFIFPIMDPGEVAAGSAFEGGHRGP